MNDCFTYGSLMCADIMARVAGGVFPSQPARLAGHRRLAVLGEDYPGLVPEAGQSVEGVLYRNLAPASWPRLDAFEGGQYRRERVTVELADGTRLVAWCYVFRPDLRHLLAEQDWDFDAFLAGGKARFEARYLGFEAI